MTEQGRQTFKATDVRPDYRKFMAWTVGECADFVGRSFETVRRWRNSPIRRRHRWKRANRVGPFTEDAMSFQRYVEDGQPHGPTASKERQKRASLHKLAAS